MTRYLLSVYQPDGPAPEPEVLGRIMADLDALNAEMRAAGAWVFAGGLHPASTATVVRSRDGEVLMTDGPYTEGKEHVGARRRATQVLWPTRPVVGIPCSSWKRTTAVVVPSP